MSLIDDARRALRGGDAVMARRLYREALRANPREFESLYMLGLLAAREARLEEAERLLNQAGAVDPASPDAHYLLGCVHQRLGRIESGFADFSRAIALRSGFAEALVNRGAIHMESGAFEAAIADFDAALAANPTIAQAWNNRANALSQLGRAAEAVDSYDRALQLRPDVVETECNRATALMALGKTSGALAGYDAALARDPASARAWSGRADALFALRRFEEAIPSYESALRYNPSSPALGTLAFTRLHCCAWETFEEDRALIAARVQAGEPIVDPFQFLAMSDSPAEQFRAARNWSRHKYPPRAELWTGERYQHDRLRVAYLSADFREHATSFLMAGAFAAHDGSRFETTAISLFRDEESPMRARMKSAFDRFIDADAMSDREVAESLRAHEIDIAIDLMGHAGGCRPGVFAFRPAPVQASYLGFPGTMACDFIDYLIADRVVVPSSEWHFYAEKIVHLPDCYQPNDWKRSIAPVAPTRAEARLPDDAFVFACFNNSYKLTPPVFGLWMRLLEAIEGSVLWLLETNNSVAANLKREASAAGIGPDRLVFAPMVAPDRHLARHRLADLFLDTLPYGAHTTASDALWTGSPLITCRGTTFAGRVAGSLLQAMDAPELIAESADSYERLAIALARDPDRLAAIRTKLQGSRDTAPLFDTARITRHLEQAYVAMWERQQRGEAPESFAVPPLS